MTRPRISPTPVSRGNRSMPGCGRPSARKHDGNSPRRASLAAIAGAALEQTAAPEGAELWSRLLLTSVRYAAKTILSNVAEKLRQERPVLSGVRSALCKS
jgi:hypothetical protein